MHAFQVAGPPALGTLCFGVFAYLLSISAVGSGLFSRNRVLVLVLAGAALLASIMSMGIGVVGYLYQIRQLDEIVQIQAAMGEDDTTMSAILEQGRAEAMMNIWIALVMAGLPLLLSVVALVRGALIKKSPANS
jgi:hypothetical protein